MCMCVSKRGWRERERERVVEEGDLKREAGREGIGGGKEILEGWERLPTSSGDGVGGCC